MRDIEYGEDVDPGDISGLPEWAQKHIERLGDYVEGVVMNPWYVVGTLSTEKFESLPLWAQERITELEDKMAEVRKARQQAREHAWRVTRNILVFALIGAAVVRAMEDSP